jgi:hypothetical protein
MVSLHSQRSASIHSTHLEYSDESITSVKINQLNQMQIIIVMTARIQHMCNNNTQDIGSLHPSI